jgi:hypothetical protein
MRSRAKDQVAKMVVHEPEIDDSTGFPAFNCTGFAQEAELVRQGG